MRIAARRSSYAVSLVAAAALLLTACGESGSSGTQPPAANSSPPAGSSAAVACEPVAGPELVALTDDKKLQTADNIIPAINAKVASADLVAALDKVSAAMSQEDLVGLNKATDIDRKSPAAVAKDFVQAKGLADGLSGGSGKIVVGAANFSENQTLANVYAEVLKAAGYDASVKTVGNRELYQPALAKGELQVVPEYAGTFTEFLNKQQNGKDAEAVASGDVDATVKALAPLAEKAGLRIGKASAAADQNTFATTKAFAEKYGVTSLSDLASKCGGGVSLGGPAECPTRPFCQPGLESTYTLKVTEFTALDAGGPLSKTALKQGKVAIALLFSSDAALAG
jgi:osmoprotectant transport system substrate-binding protein